MIHLNEDINYYSLVDGDGLSFGGWRICEGEQEVFEQFSEWADSDEIDITGYTFGDLIETWTIDIKKYNGREFIDLTDNELLTINNLN